MESFNLTNISVMVIDDHAPMRRILMSVLRELGINRLSQSANGNEALQRLREHEPDVIITDALMEPMDGLEFTGKVRTGEAGIDPFVPIIMVSGLTEMVNIVKARDAGVTEFLAKPISARSVYMRICRVISQPRPFVRTDGFFGPDRRRKAMAYGDGDRRDSPHDYGEAAKGPDEEET